MSEKGPSPKELEEIKRLLVLLLLKLGASQNEIASALKVDRSMISRMFPKGIIKKLTSKT